MAASSDGNDRARGDTSRPGIDPFEATRLELPRRAHRAAVPELGAGDHIGRFVVQRCIGEGGMGVVYAARDPELARDVAIKLVRRAGGADGATQQQRLRREAQAVAQLSHPNVVTVYDVGEHADDLYIAMELVRGVTLRHWLEAQPRSWREIVEVFCAAGRGLVAAHRAGIVHRDFKPDNVLVHGTDVRVVDFGLARPTGAQPEASGELSVQDLGTGGLEPSITRTGAVMGTPLFMAPEQHAGQVADARSDQFSFCVAFYRALYEQHPFEDICFELTPPADHRRVPRWLYRTLARGLSAETSARFGSMQELLERVDARLRRRRLVALVAVGAVALLVLTGVIGWREQRTKAQLNAARADSRELSAEVAEARQEQRRLRRETVRTRGAAEQLLREREVLTREAVDTKARIAELEQERAQLRERAAFADQSLKPVVSGRAGDGGPAVVAQELLAGERLFSEGEFVAAAELFARISEGRRIPELHYNSALAYQHAGKYCRAVTAYSAYLAGAPAAEDRADVAQRIEFLGSVCGDD